MKFFLTNFAFLILYTTSLFSQNQTGLASYYNDKYHGTRTYSGERYDKKELTCAHKSLPMGTYLKVTRLSNEKSVVVRVNDRMSSSKFIVDLSRAAAQELDLIRSGTSKVSMEVIPAPQAQPAEALATTADKTEPDAELATKGGAVGKTAVSTTPVAEQAKPKTEPEVKPSMNSNVAHPVLVNASEYQPTDLFSIALKKPEKKGYGVQIAALSSQEALFDKIAELEDDWFSTVLVNVQKGTNDEVIYKLLLGPFETEEAAHTYKDNLKKNKL
jgi:rare lipoprotein A